MSEMLKITVLAAEELDVTTDPRTAGVDDPCIAWAIPTGYNFSFAARNKGNTTGDKEDHAVAGVYGALDAKCKDTPAMAVPVVADKLYNKTGADEIVCYITNGVPTGF